MKCLQLLLWLLFWVCSASIVQAQTARLSERGVTLRPTEEERLYADHRLSISMLYPNPATTFVRFDYQLSDSAPIATITIRNVLGSELKSVRLPAGNTHIQLSIEELKPGIYFYTLTIEEENVITQKFVVKR